MALSLGNEFAALLAPSPDGHAKRGVASPQVGTLPVDPALNFAELLAAATTPEPSATPVVVPEVPELATYAQPMPTEPQLPSQPLQTPAGPAGPVATARLALPWEALAAAAEEADALAASFQWPQQPVMPRDAARNSAKDVAGEVAEAAPAEPELPASPLPDTALLSGLAPLEPAETKASLPDLDAKANKDTTPLGMTDMVVPVSAPPAPLFGQSPAPEPAPDAPIPFAADEEETARPAPLVALSRPEALVVTAAAPGTANQGRKASLPTTPPASPAKQAVRDQTAQTKEANPAVAEEPAPTPLVRQPAMEVAAPQIAPQPITAAPPADIASTSPTTPVQAPFPPGPPQEPLRVADAGRMAPAPLVIRPHQLAQASRDIVVRASKAAADGVDTVSVDLRPPELGRVELRLTFRDGTVQVSMISERVETFEALRQDRGNLEQQMQQAGLNLSSGGLDLQHGRLPAREESGSAARIHHQASAEEDEATEEVAASSRPRSDSLIDLIA